MIERTNAVNSTTTAAAAQAKKTPSNELGKDAFLQLMAAQMSYQNPLEPMENTQFLAQMAQFSALEQMQNVAKGMETLALTQTAATNSQMVNLIGKRVISPGDSFTLDGQNPVDLRYSLKDAPKEPLELWVSDGKGTLLRRVDLQNVTAGLNSVRFDGRAADGTALSAGNYTYAIRTKSGKTVADLTTYANNLVDSVAFQGQSITLKSGGRTITLADVSEVIGK